MQEKEPLSGTRKKNWNWYWRPGNGGQPRAERRVVIPEARAGLPGDDRRRKRRGPRRRLGRHETPEQRADRKWTDLLQELRVAQTGVQILFGFLLTVVFQQRFTDLSDTDRHIYVVTVMLGAATTGALIARFPAPVPPDNGFKP